MPNNRYTISRTNGGESILPPTHMSEKFDRRMIALRLRLRANQVEVSPGKQRRYIKGEEPK